MAARDFPFHAVKDPGRITASSIGLAFAPELDGDGLFSNDLSSGSYLEHITASGQDKSAGLLTSFDALAAGPLPEIEFDIRTGADIADLRLWIGLFSVKPDLLLTAPNTAHFAAFK